VSSDPLLEPPSQILWPLGQHIKDPSPESASAVLAPDDSWVDLKLRAARWYLDVLQHLESAVGLDRHAGVEMALDGCLSNLTGAVDAALARLIVTLERRLSTPPLQEHQYDLAKADKLVAQLVTQGGAAPSVGALRNARAGEKAAVPIGWLAQARRLRNRTTHHTTLARHFDAVINEPTSEGRATTKLSLPGAPGDSVDLTVWLTDCLQRAVDLCGNLLRDARATGHFIPD
jgi:hypothetical protein